MDFVKGQLVRSKAGRDKTRTLAVLEVEGEMLLLADGNLRKVGDPKRKKVKHVAPTTTVLANELLKSDQQLSDAIAAYDAACAN
ncbi:KOW domain-containing RNA-binding protein [uncultured Gemmiger sp.]|uniref:KOW domain-containing RNA-binding protein n=1 Tax=uncultured Gemmiger sp. TaxID=1623490 RepID=UPI0025DF3B12|nr:KOW domain-containing RNA-binding protein [uncultured Gemmiger sp.]